MALPQHEAQRRQHAAQQAAALRELRRQTATEIYARLLGDEARYALQRAREQQEVYAQEGEQLSADIELSSPARLAVRATDVLLAHLGFPVLSEQPDAGGDSAGGGNGQQ